MELALEENPAPEMFTYLKDNIMKVCREQFGEHREVASPGRRGGSGTGIGCY